MGVITRLFHQSEGLNENRYNVFFLDMGENIHIHYRDIRIELSVDEFLEFKKLFDLYSPQVKGEIDKGYRDGVRPNTNQTNTLTTFYNRKPLKHTIRYNPTRISLEENLDGYHVHIRNYKLLLDKPSFMNLMRAAREVLEKGERPVDLQETIKLIGVNDLIHTAGEITRDGERETVVVTVEKPYYRKTLQLLEGLGYENTDKTREAVVYEKGLARIYLRVGPVARGELAGALGSPIMVLSDFIRRNAKRFTANQLNELKLQLLDQFQYVKKQGFEAVVELDHARLLYDTAAGRIIFPTRPAGESQSPDEQYRRFNAFLAEQGLSFVKPAKLPYTEQEHSELQAAFDRYLAEQLAARPCVKRVYLLNAASARRYGRYEVPFVHFDWAKLGSDFDLMVEIDESHPLPPEWDFKFHWSVCSSDYYHLGDVAFPITSEYVDRFPHIEFRHHLVEAYLFFPSKGTTEVKDKYLKKFNAAVIYDRDATAPVAKEKTPPPAEPKTEAPNATSRKVQDPIVALLASEYGIYGARPEVLDVPSFNQVFRVRTGEGEFALKVMKREDFTTAVTGKRGQHLEYEAALLESLAGRGVPVVTPLPGRSGKILTALGDGRFAMLFPFIADRPRSSDKRIAPAAKTLAQLHRAVSVVDVATDLYRFHEAVQFWMDQYQGLFDKFTSDDEERKRLGALLPLAQRIRDDLLANRALDWLHSHGDLSPRNFFYVNEQALIFDFQAAHYGPRIEDVAEGALEFSWAGDTLRADAIDAFVAAYDAEYPLPSADRAALPAMLLLQAVQKLARSFRVEVVFNYRVDRGRIKAFLDFAEAAGEKVLRAEPVANG